VCSLTTVHCGATAPAIRRLISGEACGGGMNFCQSSATPSLTHSLAHDFRTSLGAGM
jgi:hypothetical protein